MEDVGVLRACPVHSQELRTGNTILECSLYVSLFMFEFQLWRIIPKVSAFFSPVGKFQKDGMM